MMANKKLDYWIRRNLSAEARINRNAQDVERIVATAYLKAQYYLTQKTNDLFKRGQIRTDMNESELRTSLNRTVPIEELTELKCLSKNISNQQLQRTAQNKLNSIAFKERITRIEDLKAKSFFVSKQIADVQLEKQTDFYIDTIHETYNEASSEAIIKTLEKKGVTFEVWNEHQKSKAHEFKELSTRYTKNILETHWHGSNYSKRIWNDTELLAKRLEELFTVETMTGMSEHEMAKAIAKEFDRSIGVARRLIRTEANYVANQAKLKAWKDRGVEKYRLAAILDLRTSKICQSKDGKIYLVSDAVVNGAEGTFPPFHPWCRTIAMAYFGKTSVKGTKIANDPISNKTLILKKEADYDVWMNDLKSKYSTKEIQLQKKKIKNTSRDNTEYQRIKKAISKQNSPSSLNEYQDIRYTKPSEWNNIRKELILYEKANTSTDWTKEIEGLTEDVSKKLNTIHKKLFRYSKVTGKEKLYLISKSSGEILYKKNGIEDVVDFDETLIDLLKNSDENSLILSHNHPSKYPSSFSSSDILNLFNYKSLQSLTIETSKADRYIIDRRESNLNFIGALLFTNRYRKAILHFIPKHGKIDRKWPIITHETNELLAHKYNYYYRRVQ